MYGGICRLFYASGMMISINFEALERAKKRLASVEADPAVQKGLENNPILQKLYWRQDVWGKCVICSILAIGQEKFVFQGLEEHSDPQPFFDKLIGNLWAVDEEYEPIGGIIGYHKAVLKLLEEKACGLKPCNSQFLHPLGVDIGSETDEVRLLIRQGIEHLPYLAEFYPVGGAGERLNLTDEETGAPLPVAELKFDGRTLLEGLIRDLQAKEYLYFKLFGKQITVPIVMMTSEEKKNERYIEDICYRANWFGRKFFHDIFTYSQLSVPVITKEGNWSLKEPFVLNLKPGGHGVLWRLAKSKGIFSLLKEKGIFKVLVRQINNPISGLDYGLLAFVGKGASEERAFGFASCERLLNMPEGVDVVIETPVKEGYSYVLTNVEYTEFEQRGIEDVPTEVGGTCSAYPSNTNILYADLRAVDRALETLPFPGMLINMKSKIPTLQPDGSIKEVEAGRLETTMQNIADAIEEILPHEASADELLQLKTFITYNKRSKTISVAKHAHTPGKSLDGTPEGCFRDLQKEHAALFKQCGFSVGEGCIISYHPALGPLYAIIVQKIRGGKLAAGSELRLEIAEVEIEQLDLDGSLQVRANLQGKCTLKNIKVRNKGIDHSRDNVYWKDQISRHETAVITIDGNGEFYADGIVLEGDISLVIPASTHVHAVQKGDGIELISRKIEGPTWEWGYRFDESNRIVLERT